MFARCVTFSLLVLLNTFPALAGESDPEVQFTPIAEVRPRAEVRATLDGTDALMAVNQRARLGGSLSAGPRVGMDMVVQDVRVWGEEFDTLKDFSASGLDLHIGAVRWNPVDPVTFVVGRQVIAFHEERLVGGVEWAPQGRHFDAFRMTVAKGALSADIVGAVLLEPDTLLYPDDAAAGMVRAGWSPRPAVVVDGLYLFDADDALARERHTAGVYARVGNDSFSARAEGYYQAGAVGESSIAAHLMGVSATYSPSSSLSPKITLWFDRISGDDDPTDTTITGFDTLYQTGHKYYGRMDLFFATPSDPTGRGLHDAAAKFQITPAKNAQVNLDVHAMLAAAGDDGHLGEEVDAWWTQSFGKHLRLVAGTGAFLPTEGDPSVFGWLEMGAKY